MQRQVTVRQAFWLGETEVTQGQWHTIMGTNPSHHSGCGEDCPVESVSWFDAIRFANRLSTTSGLPECYQVEGRSAFFSGLDCQGYRLPTEAEWEFAARAGGTHMYSGSKDIDEIGWYRENSGAGTNPVGRKRANAWELYDMTGNVWEWVWDWYDSYQPEDVTDPMGPSAGSRRVFRGCGWNTYALHCRTSFRHSFFPESRDPTIGVRLARSQ